MSFKRVEWLCGLTFYLMISGANISAAKGLDELKPDSETETAQPEVDASGAAEGEIEAQQVTPPPPPSETSTALAGKLFMGTGFGFSTLSGEEGDWVAGGMAEILIGYVTDAKLGEFLIATTYRYQPTDFTLDIDQRSYRGVLEGHFFGAQFTTKQKKLVYVVQTDIGVMVPSLDSLGGLDVDSDLEKIGANFAIGGGLDYLATEKVKVGGRLVVGVGSYSTVQLATSASFMF